MMKVNRRSSIKTGTVLQRSFTLLKTLIASRDESVYQSAGSLSLFNTLPHDHINTAITVIPLYRDKRQNKQKTEHFKLRCDKGRWRSTWHRCRQKIRMKAIQKNMEESERDTEHGNSKQENNSLTSQDKMKNSYLKVGLRLSHGCGLHMKSLTLYKLSKQSGCHNRLKHRKIIKYKYLLFVEFII